MALGEVVVGTVLGAGLAEAVAWWARREERGHVRRERVRERQRNAVEDLDRALDAAYRRLPAAAVKGEGEQESWDAYSAWQTGLEQAAGYVRDQELLLRYDAAGWALLTVALDLHNELDGNDWVVLRAIENAQTACRAFVLEEPLPPATFPSRGDAARMAPAVSGGRDWSALHDWLEKHPESG